MHIPKEFLPENYAKIRTALILRKSDRPKLTKVYTEFLSKQASWEAYPTAKFQLVVPTTPFKNDGHRSEY